MRRAYVNLCFFYVVLQVFSVFFSSFYYFCFCIAKEEAGSAGEQPVSNRLYHEE